MSAACAAMSVATSRSPRAALHWYPARRLPSSASTQSTASRQPGPFQCSHRAAASRAKYAACRSRVALERAASRPVGPRRTGGWSRTGGTGCASAVWSATTSDFRTSESRWRSTSTSSAPSTTAHDAREVEAAGEHRRHAQQRRARRRSSRSYDHVDRVAQRELPLRPRRRPLQQPEAIGEPVPYLDRAHRGHARRRQLDAEREPVEGRADLGHRVGGRPRSPSPKSGRTARARSTNSVTASEVAPPSSASGGTVNTVSPSTRERLARRGEDLDVPEPGRASSRWPMPPRRERARSCRSPTGAAARPATRRPCRSAARRPAA